MGKKPEYYTLTREAKKRVTMYLDPLLFELLEAYAKETNWTMAEYCAEALARHIKGKEAAGKPRKNTQPDVLGVIHEYQAGGYRQRILEKYNITEKQLKDILRVYNIPKRPERITVRKAFERGLM